MKYKLFSKSLLFITLAIGLLLGFCTQTHSKGVYQTVPDFVTEVFGVDQSAPAVLWLTPAIKNAAKDILNRRLRGVRLRYWQPAQAVEGHPKTLWVLEEIGKELPITIGVVVKDDHIDQVKILAFRESRGWEVRYPAFTAQYQNAKITTDNQLDQHIDGITGATLSVRAVNKVARLALYLHHHVSKEHVNEEHASEEKETTESRSQIPESPAKPIQQGHRQSASKNNKESNHIGKDTGKSINKEVSHIN